METPTIDEKLISQALEMIVRIELQQPELAARTRQKLERWRAGTAEHEAAWREATQRWSALSSLGADLRSGFEEPGTADLKAQRSRRRALFSLAAAVVGGATLGKGALWYWQQPLYAQNFNTEHARILSVGLPDAGSAASGTKLDLGAETVVQVRLYRQDRKLLLESGEIRLDVWHDAQRPLLVDTRAGTVLVRGTVFTVSDRGGPVSIAVEQGHVTFIPGKRADDPQILAPQDASDRIELYGGQILRMDKGKPDIQRYADARSASAWRDGWLVFDNIRLDEAVPALNAYLDHPILLADTQARAQRLTGRFRIGRIDEMPQILTEILPLRSQRRQDGSVELSIY